MVGGRVGQGRRNWQFTACTGGSIPRRNRRCRSLRRKRCTQCRCSSRDFFQGRPFQGHGRRLRRWWFRQRRLPLGYPLWQLYTLFGGRCAHDWRHGWWRRRMKLDYRGRSRSSCTFRYRFWRRGHGGLDWGWIRPFHFGRSFGRNFGKLFDLQAGSSYMSLAYGRRAVHSRAHHDVRNCDWVTALPNGFRRRSINCLAHGWWWGEHVESVADC